jgi:hypothetical protein
MNDSLITCGLSHLLNGPNCLLKKLFDDGYTIHLVDNMGNNNIYDVESQCKKQMTVDLLTIKWV